jgi:hypothetical protein
MASTLTAAMRARLRYVKVSRDDLDLSDFPDFLIVGPQRTGTTWLHAHLRYHPEILLSEPKEIFFFSRLKTPEDPKFQSADLEWYLKFFREPWWRRLWRAVESRRRFGVPYRPRVKGEATASYAALGPDVIDEIVFLNPAIKAILMVRDPIDRAWSHAKKDLVRNRGRRLEEVGDEEIMRFLGDEYQLRCAQYATNFENWRSRLQPGHLYVGRFDDIGARPKELLLDVMSFLGVESSERFLGDDVAAAVNPTGGDRIPPKYRAVLEELLGPERVRLQAAAALRHSGRK